jgi:UDP-N-acetylmuramoylalanine--D-glutamate ligase
VDGRAEQVRLGDRLPVPGRHNFQNALAATCAGLAAGASLDAICRGLASFRALPHRLQFVAEVQGRRFYNDSKATTPESAIVALEAFAEPVVLLAGGSDKHVDLTLFATAIAQHVKAVALMGQTGEHLARLIDAQAATGTPHRQVCASFQQAFCWVVDRSEPGDVVLLSPGCASFDWFRNYIERGERFAQLVENLGGPTCLPGSAAGECATGARRRDRPC